ncbi:spectrin beta chain, non-erythrocytic 1-like isoform X4 [Daphnia pulicaria]|uniref:spectrin beta chain, non-erythrocytic 1-like isoform X4 n=1 Tax=Daphnia pulicaria TaxID=35523 RepID=UPI001EE9C32E|nr:spectrin beta chain, non-erythrocytic 1-like isoform X4 [Daphnia pulicaria]
MTMSQREDVLKFEQGRIKVLQEERLHIQKKTFTKWMNSFLTKARMEVEDLFVDLADGKKLLKLLEIISGEKLAKPNNGKMRVHKIENVNKSLAFLHTKVRLESIGAEDIVDGNPRLILGLMWTIILRFQIQEIEIEVDEENESSEKKSAKDALLLWCQRKTGGYQYVNIQDFSGSWRNGMGFNALIHSHRPDIIDYGRLDPNDHVGNLQYAFDVAERELGIAPLLDAEDVDVSRPDEKSVITYVASYYHTFARMTKEQKGGRRIANIVGQMMEADRLKENYCQLSSDLLEWIQHKLVQLDDRQFPNRIEGIQGQLLDFKQYRTVEKPPKYKERSEIEALFFATNTQLATLRQPSFIPPEGVSLYALQKAWDALEKAEHRREVALRNELLRLERLEQLAYKFERKGLLRDGYLKEMIQVLSDPRYGSNLTQVEATVKKHEAICADILSRKERFHHLTSMAAELEKENYRGKDQINKREREILTRWDELLVLLERHRLALQSASQLMSVMRDLDTVASTIRDLEENFKSEDVGRHLLAAEDLTQQHHVFESQIAALGDNIQRLNRQTQQILQGADTAAVQREGPTLKIKIDDLNKDYDRVKKQAKARRGRLEDAKALFQLWEDHEEEEAWLVEKKRICQTGIVAKDLRALISLQQKHKALEDELKARWNKAEKLCEAGRELMAAGHPQSNEIAAYIDSLQKHWKELRVLAEQRKSRLEEAAEAYQFYADANETESWLREKMPLVRSTDCGEDGPGAQALLARHRDLEGQIRAYEGDIQSLNSQADRLVASGVTSLAIGNSKQQGLENGSARGEPDGEWGEEIRMIPEEYSEEESCERTEYRTVTEERLVPQVKAIYAFEGQGMTMTKGEVFFLLNKTNDDWWHVRKGSGKDGFVPANYVKEIEGKRIPVQVRQPFTVKDVRRIKKTRMTKKTVPIRKPKPPPKAAATEVESVSQRKKNINESYDEVVRLAKKRHTDLENAILLFAFNGECDDFDKWLQEKAKQLNADNRGDTVDAAKRKFEQIVTDLSASRSRLDEIDRRADELLAVKAAAPANIRARVKSIHDRSDSINKLRQAKERSLQGANSVELFHRTCDEATEWMEEKITKLDTEELGRDLQSVQALQRRHQNLERELAPLEERVNRINHLSASVTASYPEEKRAVHTRQKEVQELWEQVKSKAVDRRSRLEQAVGQQLFLKEAKSLLTWVADVKENLNAGEAARDVATAELFLKNHQDLCDDIRAHQDDFDSLAGLASKLPNNKEVREKAQQLDEERRALQRGWQQKDDFLRQTFDLQIFNKEADQIDAASSSHEAFLEFFDLGSSLDDVEALQKRHEDFENSLAAQDERLKMFSEAADKLITAKHYDSKNINERRNNVVNRRENVKNVSAKRKDALEASHTFQEFVASIDDLRSWMADKNRTVQDESYRDLTNLERKLQKHEAFELELRANEGQLRSINKTGQSMTSKNHYRKQDIDQMLDAMNDQWDALVAASLDKGRKLRQASNQVAHNKTLEDAKSKLDELSSEINQSDVGNDLRSCRERLKKQQVLENDVNSLDLKINDLVQAGEEMAQDGHFDADGILSQGQRYKKRLEAFKDPLKRRRSKLEESLRFHTFNFEMDNELQWIKEREPAARSETLGQDLHTAQSLDKKHKKLEGELTGHQPAIDNTLEVGEKLEKEDHPQKDEIEKKCQELRSSWDNLRELVVQRRKKLDLSLKAQQFFFESSEVESWMAEKTELLNSQDVGKDEDAAIKLLTKHKALELELDTYSGLINEMGNMAQAMVSNNHPDSKVITQRQHLLSQGMKNLQKLASHRRQRLVDSVSRHEYLREAESILAWINDHMITASSEDYGQDYEHLLILINKFEDFKLRIAAGSERFGQCDAIAKRLIASENPYAAEFPAKQEELRDEWSKLLETVELRDEKLVAAGEIHRFNRDVAESLSRIQEKYVAIPDDLGRDLNSVLGLIRRHENFETDLVALEAQLQILVDDSAKLQVAYPGGNADHIRAQQALVIESWNTLQERMARRKEELQDSCAFQRFLTTVRDLVTWSSGLVAIMSSTEKVHDANEAQALRAEHDRLKGEIEAREDVFSSAVQAGETMIQEEHYSAAEIKDRLIQLLQEREKLHAVWQQRKIHLDQLLDLQFFSRDAKQIESTCNTQEAALLGTDLGSTAEEVMAQFKKHEAFDKLVQAQDERLALLMEHGDKLIGQNHFESQWIMKRVAEVTVRRNRVKELSNSRRNRLRDALLYAKFVRDVSEADDWIEERQKQLDVEAALGEVTSLEDKAKRLQKHQAFQAEVSAHQGRLNEIKQTGETLISKRHEASPDIHRQLENLLQRWKQLLAASNLLGRGLEEAQDILDFNTQLEKAMAWIADKELMVQQGDLGRDYEHCQALQRKLDDVDSDMRFDDSRIKAINALGDKLVRQGRSDAPAVQQKRDALNQRWRAMQGALDEYRQDLAGALEIHAFNRDVDDTEGRVTEKTILLSAGDEGKDLPQVESLQRRQEAVERDLTAIEGKLKEHDAEARKLTAKYADMSATIRSKLTTAQDNWRKLTSTAAARRQSLASAYTFHKFKADLRELEAWVQDMNNKMEATVLANNSTDAQAALQLHQERKAEIDGRQNNFSVLKDHGRRLVQQQHPSKDEIGTCLSELEELRRTLAATWEERKVLLSQCQQLCHFDELVDQAEATLAKQEAFLNNDDLGDSLAGVQMLVRKHEAFEKTMVAQGSRFEELERFAAELLANQHYNAGGIQKQLDEALGRRDRVREASHQRRKRLEESKELHIFLRNIHEVEGWISEKLQVASDEAYRDPTNLQSKLQKQAAFEGELQANRGRVSQVTGEGEQLMAAGHFASMEIQSQLDTLDTHWRQLLDASQLRRDRLQDAYQALLFSRSLDDIDGWMDEVEQQLQSEDHGRDLTTVQHLLKKHQTLEVDIHAHADAVQSVKEAAISFHEAEHFQAVEINERSQVIIKRYQSLHEPVQIRRDNLEDALLLYQFLRDVEDELSWIREKHPVAASTELGTSLSSVQTLQKKHQALEAELQSHEPVIATVVSRGQQMIKSNHFAIHQVEQSLQQLQSQLTTLKDHASIRRLRLLDAVESQMFYSEAIEAETWIREKRQQLSNPDVGKDEDSIIGLLKKLDVIQRDVSGFNANMGRLAKLSRGLVERGHFDAPNIESKMGSVDQQYEQLKQLAETRQKNLDDNHKIHKFLREADEVADWINEQMAMAASEDYGRDVEHVEILIQKFESFLSTLNASQDRIELLKTAAKASMDDPKIDSGKIRAKVDEVNQLWDDLNELSHARQDALSGAKLVHVFDRNADETVTWITEKEAALYSEDYGQDLEGVQALLRKHAGFEHDLAAVKEQVDAVINEAQKLAGLFPDAREHIAIRHGETLRAWHDLLENGAQRKDKLQQAETLQAYFDDYRDLMAWFSEMIAKITAPELARECASAALQLAGHREYQTEIEARKEPFDRFVHMGEALIGKGHFMAEEIQDKVMTLTQRRHQLLETWQRREEIYLRNMDALLFERDASQLESWLESREKILAHEELGSSISEVEELIRRHEDFAKTLDAQDQKAEALKRITLLEKAFQHLRKLEEETRKAEAQRREQDRLEAAKRKEMQRITNERRQEEQQRRRTQEIKLTREELDRLPLNMNGAASGSGPNSVSGGSERFQGSIEGSPRIQPRINVVSAESSPSGKMDPSLTPDRLRGIVVGGVKRAESMRVTAPTGPSSLSAADASRLKRNPSFTTRKRTSSLRKVKRMDNPEDLAPVEMGGFLDRKHEQQSGGKRAAIRSWKSYYTVLCGQLLCFFKEQEDFAESKAAASPLNLYQAVCERASNYTKRKNVFRLRTSDGAEFLFSAEDQQHLDDWVKKISFHASLSPAQQLMSYDTYQAKSSLSVNPPASSLVTPTKSKTPAKEVKRNLSSIASMEAKADTEEDFHSADSGSDSDSYQKRSPDAKGPKSNKSSPSAPAPPKKRQESQAALVEPTVQAAPPVLPRTSAPSRQPSGDEVWIKVNNAAYAEVVDFPPLPRSAPPPLPPSRPPVPPRGASQPVHHHHHHQQQVRQMSSMHIVAEEWQDSSSYYASSAVAYGSGSNSRASLSSQVDGRSAGSSSSYLAPSSTGSLQHQHYQQYAQQPHHHQQSQHLQQRPVSAGDIRSDTSSESDAPATPSPREEKKDEREKRRSVLGGIFRRKGKGTHV